MRDDSAEIFSQFIQQEVVVSSSDVGRDVPSLQIFTDGSKVDEKVAAAAVSSVAPDVPNRPFACRLRDHCSICTAELQAILF